jgi:hypothetical protein
LEQDCNDWRYLVIMFNPLVEDLTHLKDTDLDSRINDLNKKYSIAMRLGNGSVGMQIAVVLDQLREEVQRRQIEASKKLMSKQNKDLDNLINVG